MSRAEHANLTDKLVEFLEAYYKDDIAELATTDTNSLWIDHKDLYRKDEDLATDLITHPDRILEELENAVEYVDTPMSIATANVDVRVTGLDETNIYSPGHVRKDQGGQYVGINGVLERVTSTSDLPQEVIFECQRCGGLKTIPQQATQKELQEPYGCEACDRQGPFEPLFDQSEWSDYAKIRVKSRPDESVDGEGKIPGYVLDELIDIGGESGLFGRAGEPVTVYGIVRRVQKTGRGEKQLLFDHVLDVRAIEFERDDDTIEIEKHKDEFQKLADRPDAVDLFADSIAPQLHATDAWDAAFEFAVAFLFGAPRIDIPQGPTYRGDLHFLMVTDFGMGKSTFKEDIKTYSPKCLSKSTTALSSGVGLTAAAVKDDFGEGQWTIKPGLLVRANGGHLLLDEIDKGPDELTDMNDALEGEQVVDIEKAGQSATYESRTAVMALGNPIEGRFDPNLPIANQLGINETLLSRFDGIVTMLDAVDEEQDEKVAETYGQSYTEAQAKQYGDRSELDTLERPVPVDVGRAWVKYARENVNPLLRYEQFEELKEWYASEIRQANNSFAGDGGDGADMPVPATVRELAAAVKMSLAFARVHLREEVASEDVERAKKLGKRLVKQNWNGERFDAAQNQGSGTRKQVVDALDSDDWQYPSDIARKTGLDESDVRSRLKTLATEYSPAKAEEKNGKYRLM